MVDEELLQSRVEADILNHLEAIDEIFSIKECDEIADTRDLNIIGLINGLATKIIASSEDFGLNDRSKEEELSNEAIAFIDRFSKKMGKHPIDSIFYSIKILSDILVQLTIIDEMNSEKDNEPKTEE